MDVDIFISQSSFYPCRWKEAFPGAGFVDQAPAREPGPGAILWLHNMLPSALDLKWAPGRRWFIVVMDDQPSEERGLEALSLGASGYCNAYASPDVLREVASVVRSHGLWVGEALLRRLVSSIAQVVGANDAQRQHPQLQMLSEREREVALCVANGESNKEIARKLDLAERTVKAHLTAVFEQLKVRDRLQLALLLKALGR